MSVQSDLEDAIVSLIEATVPTFNAVRGPRTVAQLEGDDRSAAVRRTAYEAERLAYGQNQLTELYAITFFWAETIDRDTSITEWESLEGAFLTNQFLTSEVQDCYFADSAWGESSDGSQFRTMTATLEVLRVI